MAAGAVAAARRSLSPFGEKAAPLSRLAEFILRREH
jgi:hypothetical protein